MIPVHFHFLFISSFDGIGLALAVWALESISKHLSSISFQAVYKPLTPNKVPNLCTQKPEFGASHLRSGSNSCAAVFKKILCQSSACRGDVPENGLSSPYIFSSDDSLEEFFRLRNPQEDITFPLTR